MSSYVIILLVWQPWKYYIYCTEWQRERIFKLLLKQHSGGCTRSPPLRAIKSKGVTSQGHCSVVFMATSQHSLPFDWPITHTNDITGQGAAIGQQIPSHSFCTRPLQQCALHEPRLWQKGFLKQSVSLIGNISTNQTSANTPPGFHLAHSSY